MIMVAISLSDINECATDNGNCEHTCNNIPGGHTCSYDSGYMLNNDGRTCRGKY